MAKSKSYNYQQLNKVKSEGSKQSLIQILQSQIQLLQSQIQIFPRSNPKENARAYNRSISYKF